jgi:hypothetical protein
MPFKWFRLLLDVAIRKTGISSCVNVKNINRVFVVPLFREECGAIGIECKCIHINYLIFEVMLNSVLQSYTQAILSVLSIIMLFEI